MEFRFDYTKTMMMKLFMAKPNRKGGSDVFCTFAQALELIKTLDALTVGAPKIIYLVGWQYNGHDDKYPGFFEVNRALKRPEDDTARDSLLFLMEEAKKYHTTVSLHINFADAYENSPVFADYIINKALIRDKSGKPAKVEEYNGLPCYKVSYKEEWESGLFKKRVDKLLSMLPIEDAGTIHVDNFQCYVNHSPKISAYEMQLYRKKMIDYMAQKGIDITSEFTYREGKLTKFAHGAVVREWLKTRYPIDLMGRIPAVWWVDNLSDEEIMKYYPHSYCGGILKNERFARALYGNIHGETLWLGGMETEKWKDEFIRQFAMINVPFFYLNSKIKKNFFCDKTGVTVEFTDGTVSEGRTTQLRIGSKVLKNGGFVCLPIFWQENSYIAYFEQDGTATVYLDGKNASVYEITESGMIFLEDVPIFDGKTELKAEKKKLYLIKT